MNRLDAIDGLTARLGMLEAQALTLTDGGQEPFLRLAGEIRSNYFWAMQMGLEECIELVPHVRVGANHNEDTLDRRLRAMHTTCLVMMMDAAEGIARLAADLLGSLMMGLADGLRFCHELASELAPEPRPAVAGAA